MESNALALPYMRPKWDESEADADRTALALFNSGHLTALLTLAPAPPIHAPMDDKVGTPEKPTIEEVLQYADRQIDKYIRDHASHLPPEQKDEVRQEALLRVANLYADLDVTRGWKSLVQHHARGATLDFLRDGKGFQEDKWDDAPDDAEGSDADPEEALDGAEASGCGPTPERRRKYRQRLTQRVSVVNSDDDTVMDVGEVAGLYGVHSGPADDGVFKPRWDLVARMASVDPEIHLVAKILRGFTQTELAPGFQVTREMLSQRIRLFFEKLDDPQFYQSPWVAQIIYAFRALGSLPHGPGR
jgi:DNA-directed RNA polymerase specialized sigma24 family protein